MIRVAWLIIRSNERVILPKTNGTNISAIFICWNIVGKISTTRTLIFFHSISSPLSFCKLEIYHILIRPKITPIKAPIWQFKNVLSLFHIESRSLQQTSALKIIIQQLHLQDFLDPGGRCFLYQSRKGNRNIITLFQVFGADSRPPSQIRGLFHYGKGKSSPEINIIDLHALNRYGTI